MDQKYDFGFPAENPGKTCLVEHTGLISHCDTLKFKQTQFPGCWVVVFFKNNLEQPFHELIITGNMM